MQTAPIEGLQSISGASQRTNPNQTLMSASQSAVNLPHMDIWKRELVKLISKQSKQAKQGKKPEQRGLELAGVYQHTRS